MSITVFYPSNNYSRYETCNESLQKNRVIYYVKICLLAVGPFVCDENVTAAREASLYLLDNTMTGPRQG